MNLEQRLQGLRTSVNGVQTLESYVEFWGNYIPEIYGIAKALLAVRETDKDAAAAWNDRMQVLHEGVRSVIECFVRESALSPEWDPDQAADAVWAMMSISVWENLTVERGWSKDEYINRMKAILKKMLVKE